MTTADHAEQIVRSATGAAVLPERLGRRWRTILATGDAAIVLFVSLVVLNGGDGSRVAAAILTAAIICGMFWQCGFYKRSYAVYPHDEAYYACAGVLFAAIPVLLILAAIGDIPLVSIALALLFSALGTSVLRVRMHLERRAAPPHAGIDSITPGAWHDRESPWFLLGKRMYDVTVALVVLMLASPIMLIAALAISLESSGPVFFRQDRVGLNGRPFRIWKFRTMRTGAGTDWARPGDDRITRVGRILRRASIDELPQLFNVLRGEMSIVGPRPEMVQFARSFTETLRSYPQRHVVAPGITGWAQLYLERNLDPNDVPRVLPYDLFYVEHASPPLDAALTLKTAVEVFFHRAV